MQIALFQPDIPQNTGTILQALRLPGVGRPHHRTRRFSCLRPLVPPGGNGLSQPCQRDAARPWSKFSAWRTEQGYRLLLFTTKGATNYLDFRYQTSDILLFGRESAGVTDEVVEAADARLVIPINPGLRSLNVAMTAAMAAGEALRQVRNPQV